MEHQEIYEWLKELAFKNCDKENREQIFWFFEDILEDEIKVEKQEDEIERLNGIIQMKQERIDKLNNKIIRRDNIIEDLKAILKSKGYETYIPILERSDKE